MKYLVKEIFGPTIQGEGRFTGTPVKFLRLSKCNKWNGRPESKPTSICNYCDTDFVGGERMQTPEIITHLEELYPGLMRVVVTGGEPLLQIQDGKLIDELIAFGYHVQLETNGSIYTEPRDNLHITVSPKQFFTETKIYRNCDMKFLYPWIHPNITPYDFDLSLVNNLYIQPIAREGEDNTKDAFEEILRLSHAGIEAKLSLQTHKYAGFE